MRHVHALLAVGLASLACGGLPLAEEEVPPPEPAPVVEVPCEGPGAEPGTCARVGRDLVVRREGGRLQVVVRGEPSDQLFHDGEVRAVELDEDPRKEVLVSRCVGAACVPDWFVLDCGPGGRCSEAPLIEQQAEIRIADGSDGRHRVWALGPGTITCRQLVRGRAEPCDGWTEEVAGPVRQRVAPAQPPGPEADGKVVASLDLDLDADGDAEHVACAWEQAGGRLRCSTELHGAVAALPSAVEVGFLGTSTDGVLDALADGRTGRWDGAGWVFAW